MEGEAAKNAPPTSVPVLVEVVKKEPQEYIQNKYQLDETLKRILSHRGIVGTIVTDGYGIPIESTMDKPTTAKYASYMIPLAVKSRDLIRGNKRRISYSF